MGVLSNLTIAATGALPADSTTIKKWVEVNGGRWSSGVDQGVTHLVTGKDAWNKATKTVIQAAQLDTHIVSYDWLEDSLQQKRKLAEKHYTWETLKRDKKRKKELKKLGKIADGMKFIEGCKRITELTGSGTSEKFPPARKPKKSNRFFFAEIADMPFLSAKDDLLRRRAAREAAEQGKIAAKATKKLRTLRFADFPIKIKSDSTGAASLSSLVTPPVSASPADFTSTIPKSPSRIARTSTPSKYQAKQSSLKDLYHYYLDSTGFEYRVTLARTNFALNNITRYQISILESHTKPPTYCTFVQYTPPSKEIQGPSAITPCSTTTNIRNPLLSFLKLGDGGIDRSRSQTVSNDVAAQSTVHVERACMQCKIQFDYHKETERAEAARLRSLASPTPSSPIIPYKTLICPMDSPFHAAWRAFRHVFRDLTLISWEERFDAGKTVQKGRAKALSIEPYTYSKPSPGMPIGLLAQEVGLYQGGANDTMIHGDAEDGYVRNAFALPGVDEPLGRWGVIGAAVWREEENARLKTEKEQLEDIGQSKRRDVGQRKKVNYKKPLFSCVMD